MSKASLYPKTTDVKGKYDNCITKASFICNNLGNSIFFVYSAIYVTDNRESTVFIFFVT